MSRIEKIGRLKDKARKRTAKRSKRKEELADFAIDALKQLGYARTSLRDIAEHSGVSVGTLHYYFEDRVDLISFCVRKYKEDFIAEMDKILLGSLDSNAIVNGFARGLRESVQNDAETHRLWYDIRTQAMFEEEFHEVVGEIENGLIDLVRRLMKRLGMPEEVVLPVYLNLDGAFRYYLQRHLLGDETAVEDFGELVSVQLGQLVSSVAAE
ncbi:MAG: TetR/AcrR family transcriptional regulator [Rhodobacteraceae bacterium]|nr:TetR/AcrR family transcriptional regulator [Paracoccaceae bacterium]